VSAAEDRLSDELAKCIGAMRGAADALRAQGAPQTAAAVRKVADDAYAVLMTYAAEVDHAA
jgi:hypothetical protein